MSTTAQETITLEVDGREVVVPKGTPLVLAAAANGVEIPIFCYEPRLGPAVGACRMCMVEVEGMPKLQAACTMTATDGMKVHTKNERAAEAQKAVLEFLLINHPLDCPVCDKGGECPLQDLTFRFGPGNTRFRLPKRTYEKPVPVSPLIALDRERCILCYRCTRFSADVSQDELLIPRERGSRSIIATFEERPYASPFSGNVTELCPVGALTATGYRFKARPWEIDNVPTVCGLCPTGCNTWATVREDRVRRVLSRDRSDLDEGWLCDKGRFAYEHVRADDRYTTPLVRGERGLDEATWEHAAETVARRLRHYANLYGPDALAVVASGEQSNEEAFAWREIVEASGGGALVGSGRPWELLEPSRATIADLDHADVIVVAGDRDVRDLAGVLELRIRKAVRGGAQLILAGAGGTQLDLLASERIATAPGQVASSADALVERLTAATRPVLLVTDRIPLEDVAAIAARSGLRDKPGGVLPLPEAPNELGVRAAGFRADPSAVLDRAERGELRMLVMLGDADPVSRGPHAERWRNALQRAESVVVSSLFPNEATLWAHVILPATATLEKEGSSTNLEGRAQRLRPTLPPPAGVIPELSFLGELGRRLETPQPDHVAAIHRRLAAAEPERFAGWAATVAARAPGKAGRASTGSPRAPRPSTTPVAAAAGTLQVVAYRPLISGPAVERAERLHFLQPHEIVLAHADAQRLGLNEGQQVLVVHEGGRTSGPLHISRSQQTGAIRVPWLGAPVTGSATVEAAG
ncbi:MAG: NADH-quinone oxidoreductase subunit [Gaiellales bacterium]|nr:NADH-quinone oxidoreductase subunit [Gaiellales bacterium]